MKTKATIKTVADIRAWLDSQEVDYTEKGMPNLFGSFESQRLLMPHITHDGTCEGYGEFQVGYSADGVYMILDWENKSEETEKEDHGN